MIFQHTINKVLSGQKIQTRRIVKPGQELCEYSNGTKYVIGNHGFVYNCGQSYSVQPGRGKFGVARIRIVDIWREDCRYINPDDVRAEGFGFWLDFMIVWCRMHDPKALKITDYRREALSSAIVRARPAALYDTWAIKFELEVTP